MESTFSKSTMCGLECSITTHTPRNVEAVVHSLAWQQYLNLLPTLLKLKEYLQILLFHFDFDMILQIAFAFLTTRYTVILLYYNIIHLTLMLPMLTSILPLSNCGAERTELLILPRATPETCQQQHQHNFSPLPLNCSREFDLT